LTGDFLDAWDFWDNRKVPAGAADILRLLLHAGPGLAKEDVEPA